jgi:hypothetical protein
MENQPDYILLNRIGRSFIEQKALVEHSDDQNGQLRQAYNALTAMNAELHASATPRARQGGAATGANAFSAK